MRQLAAILVVLLGLATSLAAQEGTIVVDQDQFPVADVSTPILTVDLDRLFAQSAFGQSILSGYNDQRRGLAAENREIADALRTEELDLAERRPGMDPELFRAEAEAFDEKAQGIRRAQDAKEQSIEEDLTAARDAFLAAIQPILGEIMIERRASVILHQQTILLSLNRIDITEQAIARIDETLGEGPQD